MRKDFYIFRHGQTDFNKERRWAGCASDVDLNETGIEQAVALAENLRRIGLEVIFASNLIRARHTAAVVAEKLGLEVRIEPMFREGDFGIADGRLIEELEKEDPKLREEWNNLTPEFLDVRYPGGESKREIQDRMFAALESLAQENFKVIGIASHGAAIRYLLMKFGLVIPKISNGQPYHLVLEDGKWRCEPFGAAGQI